MPIASNDERLEMALKVENFYHLRQEITLAPNSTKEHTIWLSTRIKNELMHGKSWDRYPYSD